MYVQIGSSVIICYVRVRETLAAANRLQRYNKKLNYTNIFVIFLVFVPLRTHSHTLSRYVLLINECITDLFLYLSHGRHTGF